MSDLRGRLRALDQLPPPSDWEDPASREPGEPVGPAGRSRLAPVVLALVVSAAGAILVIRGFAGQGPVTVRPGGSGSSANPTSASPLNPDEICGLVQAPPGRLVQVGGAEFPRSVLEREDAADQDLDTPAAAALRRLIENPRGIPELPRTGWRVALEASDRVTFVAPEAGGSWTLVNVVLEDGRWESGSSGHGQEPVLASVDRGRGLALEWGGPVTSEAGDYPPQTDLRVVNHRETTWVDDRGEYWGIAHVFDPVTGEEFRDDDEVAIAGTGLEYRVAPGDSFGLPVAYLPDITALGLGEYDIVACVHELNLASPVGRLILT